MGQVSVNEGRVASESGRLRQPVAAGGAPGATGPPPHEMQSCAMSYARVPPKAGRAAWLVISRTSLAVIAFLRAICSYCSRVAAGHFPNTSLSNALRAPAACSRKLNLPTGRSEPSLSRPDFQIYLILIALSAGSMAKRPPTCAPRRKARSKAKIRRTHNSENPRSQTTRPIFCSRAS